MSSLAFIFDHTEFIKTSTLCSVSNINNTHFSNLQDLSFFSLSSKFSYILSKRKILFCGQVCYCLKRAARTTWAAAASIPLMLV